MLVIMRYLFQLIRNYPLTVAIYIVVIYLSFFTPPRIEDLENVMFIDKWTHIVMYGGSCGVMWFEYLRRHKTVTEKIKLFLLIWLAPATFSGIIELMQEYSLEAGAVATGTTSSPISLVLVLLLLLEFLLQGAAPNNKWELAQMTVIETAVASHLLGYE